MISIQQTGQNRFLYPYNFVRVNEAVPPAREKPASHGWLDPARYSGKFKVKVSLESPLFVPAAEPCQVTEREGKSHKWFRFCRDEDGAPRLPETSIKGALRSTFEALTNSCFSVFGTAGRHVGLRYNPKRAEQPNLRFLPGRVVAGPGPSGLAVQPCFVAWSDSLLTMYAAGQAVNYAYLTIQGNHNAAKYCIVDGVLCRKIGNNQANWPGVAIPSPAATRTGHFKPGWLLGPTTNPFTHNHDRFFRPDLSAGLIAIPVAAAAAYDRVVKEQNDLLGPDFSIRPGFGPEIKNLAVGDLIYYRESRSLRHGIELSRTAIPRVSSDWTIGELLPAAHHACQKADSLCPACRVFGWVNSAGPGAYAGNVRILATRWVGRALPAQPGDAAFTELRIQGTPHPESANLYIVDKDELNTDDVEYQHTRSGVATPVGKIRGRKRYWVRGTQRRPQDWTMPARHPYHGKDQSIHAELLPAGAGHFEFEVRFENLTDVELGALLFTVELPWKADGGGKHTLGRGKPLGLGIVTMKVDGNVELMDTASRYGATPPASLALRCRTKQDLIEKLKDAWPANLAAMRSDLETMTRPVAVAVRYPQFVGEDAAKLGEKTFGWFSGATRYDAPAYQSEVRAGNGNRINRRDLPLPMPAEAPSQLFGGDEGGLRNS